MGSNLGHGAFIAPTKEDVVAAWGIVRYLETLGYQKQAESVSRILQAYERIAALVPREE